MLGGRQVAAGGGGTGGVRRLGLSGGCRQDKTGDRVEYCCNYLVSRAKIPLRCLIVCHNSREGEEHYRYIV